MLFITLLVVLIVVARAQDEGGVQFGFDVSVSDDILVVGSSDASQPNTGNAYILKRYLIPGSWKFNAQVDIDVADPFPGNPPPYASSFGCGASGDCSSYGQSVATGISVDTAAGTTTNYALVGDPTGSGGSEDAVSGTTYQYEGPLYGNPTGTNIVHLSGIGSFGRLIKAQGNLVLVAGTNVKGSLVLYEKDPVTGLLSVLQTYIWSELFGNEGGVQVPTPTGLPEIARGSGPTGVAMDMDVDHLGAGTSGLLGFTISSNCGPTVVMGGVIIDNPTCDTADNPANHVLLFKFSANGVPRPTPDYDLIDPTPVDSNQAQNSAGFGHSVAIGYSKYVAVSAPGRYYMEGSTPILNAGYVYLYLFDGSDYVLMTTGPALDIAWTPTGQTENAYYGMVVSMRSKNNDDNFVMAVTEPMSQGYVSGDTGATVGSVHVHSYQGGVMTSNTFVNLPTDGFYLGLSLSMTNANNYLVIGAPAEDGFIKVCIPNENLVYSDTVALCDTIQYSELGVFHAPTPEPSLAPTDAPTTAPTHATSQPTSFSTKAKVSPFEAATGLDAYDVWVLSIIGSVTGVVGLVMIYNQIVHNRAVARAAGKSALVGGSGGLATQEAL